MIDFIYNIIVKLLSFYEFFKLLFVFSRSFFPLYKRYKTLRKELNKMTLSEAQEFLEDINEISNAIDKLTLKVKKRLVSQLLQNYESEVLKD